MLATDPAEKQILERGDFLANEDNAPWAAPDPRLDLAKQHVAPGMRPKFVSERKLTKSGRDPRGFEVVKDERGNAVTHGTSVLAQIPEEMAERRNQHFQKQSQDLVSEVYAKADDSEKARRTNPETLLNSRQNR